MTSEDFLFVWNCCDELEKARERETVLRIVESLRDRFGPRAFDAEVSMTPEQLTTELSGIADLHKTVLREAPQCSNTEAFLRGDNTGCDGVHCPVHKHGLPAPESGVDFEQPDLNTPDGSSDFEVEQ